MRPQLEQIWELREKVQDLEERLRHALEVNEQRLDEIADLEDRIMFAEAGEDL